MKMGGSQVATALANTTSYVNYYFAANRSSADYGAMPENSRRPAQETLHERERLATEQERNRQHRLLHDSALQTLEAVAGRNDVGSDDHPPSGPPGGGGAAPSDLRRSVPGASCATTSRSWPRNSPSGDSRSTWSRPSSLTSNRRPVAVSALCEATREALMNVLKHPGRH